VIGADGDINVALVDDTHVAVDGLQHRRQILGKIPDR
jgi:hypothetical protein